MKAEDELTKACLEWQSWAEAAGEAIDRSDWHQLTDCHQAIRLLQQRMLKLFPAVREDWAKSGSDRSVRGAAMHMAFQDLIGLTRRNQALLAEKKRVARLELDRARVSAQNLRLIRRSYVLVRSSLRTAFA